MSQSNGHNGTEVRIRETNRLLQELIDNGGSGGGGGDLATAAKGATVAGSPTSEELSANIQGLDVIIRDSAGNQIDTFGGASVGTDADNAAITVNSPVLNGGKAVTTSSYSPVYTALDAATFAVDKDNGGILVNQANLAEAQDNVVAYLKTTSSSSGTPDAFRSASLVNVAQAVKATAGSLYGWNIRNNTAAAVYVKFCNTASGSTTPGTTAIVLSIMVPANGTVYQAPNCSQHYFSTAITVYACTGFLDTDATTTGANNVVVELKYK